MRARLALSLLLVLAILLLLPFAASGIVSQVSSPAAVPTRGDPAGGSVPIQGDTGAPTFTIALLPDTQYYSASLFGGTPQMFRAQTQWIADNRKAWNIVFTAQLGDVVEHGGEKAEWDQANAALGVLDASGIPYTVAAGNHDIMQRGLRAELFESYFGVARFVGRSYYGGHYGPDNYNRYDLFRAGGMDFIVLTLAYRSSPDPSILRWANEILAQNRTRRAMLVSHSLIEEGNPAPWTMEGRPIYDALKGNANLFLMLAGHNSEEARRVDRDGGHPIYTLLSDYQSRAHGGDGWLRLLMFEPAQNRIEARTYSPVLGRFERDDSSEFSLPYAMK